MNVFNTKRPMMPEEVLNQAAQDEIQRRINRDSLNTQIAMERHEFDLQQNIDLEAKERESKRNYDTELEEAAQRRRMDRANETLLEAKLNMPKEGEVSIIKDLLCDIVIEGLWIDDPIKNSPDMRDKIMEQIDTVLSKCERVTGKTLIESMNNSKLLSYIADVAKNISAMASNRIITEAEEIKDVSINFSLSTSEKEDLDAKMCDIDTSKIASAIKDKVLDVVKKESEAGKVKAELFKELDSAEKTIDGENEPDTSGTTEYTSNEPNDETGDDANEVAESLIGCTLEEALECIKNKQAEQETPHRTYPIRVLTKLADKTAIMGNLTEAAKIYEEAKDRCEYLTNHIGVPNNAEYDYMMESIINATEARLFNVPHYSHKVTPRTEFSKNVTEKHVFEGSVPSITLRNALGILQAYCGSMEWSISHNNIVTETFEQQMARERKYRIQRALNDTTNATLFENLMMRNLNSIYNSRPVNTDGIQLLESEVQNAAFIQTILDYTIFETVNTMNIYNINSEVIKKLKEM